MQCSVISSYIVLHDFSPSNITMSCHVVSCHVYHVEFQYGSLGAVFGQPILGNN